MTPHTVFIVGAGASKPFDLPTGNQLLVDITSDPGKVALVDLPRKHGPIEDLERSIALDQASKFCNELRNSGCSSVDQFLEYRPEYLKIGKRAIARFLLPNELAAIHNPPNHWDWLGWLFNQTMSGDNRGKLGYCSFIIFNYDRLVKLSLTIMARNRSGPHSKGLEEFIDRLDIIHVYGDLATNVLDHYSHTDRYHNLLDAVNLSANSGLRLIPEERTDEYSEEFYSAQELISDSERVVFLGFGYDPTNMKRLGITRTNPLHKKEVYGTTLGMIGTELRRAHSYFSGSSIVHLDSVDCLTLLRRYVDFD